jgi:hypothetical protein
MIESNALSTIDYSMNEQHHHDAQEQTTLVHLAQKSSKQTRSSCHLHFRGEASNPFGYGSEMDKGRTTQKIQAGIYVEMTSHVMTA